MIIAIFLTASIAFGGGSGKKGDWEFSFFGINANDFRGRSFTKTFIGVVGSLITHELGHYAVGLMYGNDVYFSSIDTVTVEGDLSHGEMQIFYAGGFIAQAVVGGVLTLIPATRKSDFALGFNSFTAASNFLYLREQDSGEYPYSDIANLDNGTAIGISSGVYHGVLTYINLNKERN